MANLFLLLLTGCVYKIGEQIAIPLEAAPITVRESFERRFPHRLVKRTNIEKFRGEVVFYTFYFIDSDGMEKSVNVFPDGQAGDPRVLPKE